MHRPILAELARRGTPFRGFLYAGLILTADGPVLLETNVRLGDPEAQAILPRLDGATRARSCSRRRAARIPADAPTLLPARPSAAVGIVLAAKGYPGDPRRGDPIEGLDGRRGRRARSCSTPAPSARHREGGFGTNGGPRADGRRPSATTSTDARLAAERGAGAISWDGMQRRHDIAATCRARVPAGAPA